MMITCASRVNSSCCASVTGRLSRKVALEADAGSSSRWGRFSMGLMLMVQWVKRPGFPSDPS